MSRSAQFLGLGGWALIAALATPGHAAVPVEESVEESVDESLEDRRTSASSTLRQSSPSDARSPRVAQRRSLGIPPTIEPGATIIEEESPSTQAPPPRGMSANAQLFYQIQVLQQEVQALRGLVEEQQYQIKRLEQDSATQYRDLDRRLSGMTPSTDATTKPAAVNDAPAGAAGSEREAYQQAFGAMQAKQYEASMAGFQQVIEQYPNGQFTPNAYYWLGELHLLASSDAEMARQSFMQVINLYPDHQKTADALYKLGVVYSTLGDDETARAYLLRVQQEHPDSAAANLAAQYAAAL